MLILHYNYNYKMNVLATLIKHCQDVKIKFKPLHKILIQIIFWIIFFCTTLLQRCRNVLETLYSAVIFTLLQRCYNVHLTFSFKRLRFPKKRSWNVSATFIAMWVRLGQRSHSSKMDIVPTLSRNVVFKHFNELGVLRSNKI